MAKIILTTSEKKEWDAHKVIETSVNLSIIQKDKDKFEIHSNSNDGLIQIELSFDEFKKLLLQMHSLKGDIR